MTCRHHQNLACAVELVEGAAADVNRHVYINQYGRLKLLDDVM